MNTITLAMAYHSLAYTGLPHMPLKQEKEDARCNFTPPKAVGFLADLL